MPRKPKNMTPEQDAAWRANRDEVYRRWRAANYEKVCAINRASNAKWQAANPGKRSASNMAYAAKRRAEDPAAFAAARAVRDKKYYEKRKLNREYEQFLRSMGDSDETG